MLERLLLVFVTTSVGCASAPPSPEIPAATASGSSMAAPTSTPSAAASASPSPASERRTWLVDSKRVACEGEGVTECLRVRASKSEDWTLFYRTIEGFTFEPGNAYELEVEMVRESNAPADAPARRVKLLKVVTKTKETP